MGIAGGGPRAGRRCAQHLLVASLFFQDAQIIFVQIPRSFFTLRFVSRFDSRALGDFSRKDQPLIVSRSAHTAYQVLHSFLDELPEFSGSFFSRGTAGVAGDFPQLLARHPRLLRERGAEKQEIHDRVFIAPRQPLANLCIA